MNATPIRIGEIIDRAKISPYQIAILSMCFIIVLIDGFDTAAIGYIAPSLREEWGLEPRQLSPVFGAGLFGLMVGSLMLGPIADAVGRKRVLLVSILVFGLATLASAYTQTIESLTILRFVTGIGLGGAMPACIALSAEYSPKRRRMILVTLSWSGFTAGLALGGMLAAYLIPAHGWRSVLILGGVLPLLLLPLLAWLMPESVQFMASKAKYVERLRKVVERITRTSWSGITISGDQDHDQARSPVKYLFIEGRLIRTLLLWLSFFCSLFVFYLLSSWLPTLLKDSGYDIAHASRIGAMVPLGGTAGALLMAMLMDRTGPYPVLAVAYSVTAVVVAITGYMMGDAYQLAAIVFVIGFGIAGAQNGLNLVAATLYPTTARVTGVSWAMALGRSGSIVGSMMGAWVIATAGNAQAFFQCLAVPVAAAAITLCTLYWLDTRKRGPLPSPVTAHTESQ